VFLHLLRPDRKFFGPLQALFEAAAPGRNLWVAVGPPDEGFVFPPGAVHVTRRDGLSNAIPAGAELDGVVLNGLPFSVAGALLDGLPTVAVAWYVWGFEAYRYWDVLRARLLLPQTRRLSQELDHAGLGRRLLRRAASRWMRRNRETAGRLVERLDFCVTPIREEYDLFVSAGLPATTQYQFGLVGCLDDYVDGDDAASCGDDVQLGNSASLSNNHLDALTVLSRPGLGPRRVVVPLGYGDRRCRDAVAAFGREALGERFVPLMGFIPPDDYRAVVGSCGHVVMNHLRQQALGNIFAALWRGARVYMNDTTAYRDLKSIGFDVRLISSDLDGPDGLRLDRPGGAEAARQRDLLREQYARDRVIDETRGILERLSDASARKRRTRGRAER